MARLHDVPTVLRDVGLKAFAKRVWFETFDDDLPMFAGTLAYAWLFALFPFVIFVLSVVPFLPGASHRAVETDTVVILHALLPDRLVDAVVSNARGVHREHRRGWVAVGSLLVTLWVASSGMTVTMAALDKCYEIEQVRAYHRRRPMAFALTLLLASITVATTVLLTLGPVGREWIVRRAATGSVVGLVWAYDVLRGAVALAAALFALGLLYHVGPCVKRLYRPVTPGAVFAFIVWVVLGLAFKEYVNRFSGSRYEETYGAAGWVITLLVVLYADALVLMIGAEINSEIDFAMLNVARGSRDYRPAERAVRLLEAQEAAAASHR